MKLGLQLNSFDWKGGPEQFGRDLVEIGRVAEDVGECGEKVVELVGQLRWLAGMGIETVIGFVPNVDRIEPLKTIGQRVIPAVAGL